MRGRERERERVCEREGERERVCVCERERGERVCERERMLQIHRYTDSVLQQNTADPSHISNSSRPGETSVSARRTQDLLCVCCSICVSLSPQKRRHSTCPELMFPAHLDYIMPYYSVILLKCIFCLCISYTLSI